jgi:putative nucleotidyltransferase-like protein
MTPESECLLATLRHTCPGAPAAIHWPALLDQAESHGVLMLFCADFPGELPPALLERARSHWTTAAFMATELEGLLVEFSRHAIEVLPLKGPLLANHLYGRQSLRISDDLDLLVRTNALPQAKALLLELGFTATAEADDYHQCFQREDTLVELHFAVAPPSSPAMNIEAAWARAGLVAFRGQKAMCFAPADLVLYLVIHAVKHEFARMLWVIDFSLALAKLNDEEVQQLLGMAHALGIEGALLTTCALARLTLHIALPTPIADAIAGQPAITGHARALLAQLLNGPADATTTHQGAGTFLRLESSARARWAQRLRMFRPSHQDHRWAESHKIHPRWLPLLRPLRLLRKHGVSAAWRLASSPPESRAGLRSARESPADPPGGTKVMNAKLW